MITKEKLVRDRIPEILNDMNIRPFGCRQVEGEEKEYYLWEKLYEEMRQFFKEPVIEELVDIIEVGLAIIANETGESVNSDELVTQLLHKRFSKGKFDKGYVMEFPK